MFQWANMLVMKVTRDCNLRCKYCYLKNKDNYKGEIIDFELFKVVIQRIIKDKLKSNNHHEKFSLVFHGGEPLLLDSEKFAIMLDYAQNEFNKNSINYDFCVQTNLTLLDEEKALLMQKYNVHVGASFDGIKKGNEGRTKSFTQDKFEEKFFMMNDYNVDYSFLSVVNKANFESIQESIKFAEEEYGVDGFKVNYAEDIFKEDPGKDNETSEIDGELFFEKAWKPFINKYLDFENNEKYPKLDTNVQLIINKFLEDSFVIKERTKRGNCGVKVCGGGINIVEMNPDGSLYFCGRYSEDDDKVFVDDIHNRDFLSLHQLKRFSDFTIEKHKVLLDTKCDTCYAATICDFGCMAFHYSTYKEFGIKDYLVCKIFKNMYKYLIKNQTKLVVAYFHYNKNENSEARIVLGEKGITQFKQNSKLLNLLKNEYGINVSFYPKTNESNTYISITKGK